MMTDKKTSPGERRKEEDNSLFGMENELYSYNNESIPLQSVSASYIVDQQKKLKDDPLDLSNITMVEIEEEKEEESRTPIFAQTQKNMSNKQTGVAGTTEKTLTPFETYGSF